MKLYIAGKMTGLPDHGLPAFNEAAELLEECGYTVINPAAHGVGELAWEQYLRRDLRWLLNCEGVATLLGWTTSRGAKLEVHVARELGMDVRPVESWLELRAKEMAI